MRRPFDKLRAGKHPPPFVFAPAPQDGTPLHFARRDFAKKAAGTTLRIRIYKGVSQTPIVDNKMYYFFRKCQKVSITCPP
jgi:hypothetical protein